MKTIGQAVLGFLLLLMVGCSASPPPLQCDPSPTCWYGIVPGVTRFEEAGDILKNRYKIDNLVIDNRLNEIHWAAHDLDSYEGVSVTSLKGVIYEISVGYFHNQMLVSDLIEQLGEPSYVVMVMAFSSETKCAGLQIVFADKGIVANVVSEGYFVGVSPSQSVSGVSLMPTDVTQNYPILDTFFDDWQGYMDYCPE